jgi:hypothetical protein
MLHGTTNELLCNSLASEADVPRQGKTIAEACSRIGSINRIFGEPGRLPGRLRSAGLLATPAPFA